MGFTPSTSETALRQNNGDVTQTVDWLIYNEQTEHAGLVSTPERLPSKHPDVDSVPARQTRRRHGLEHTEDHIDIDSDVQTATSALQMHPQQTLIYNTFIDRAHNAIR